jgi:recombination protein RecA
MKIGVMFGNPETTTGGNALKFYASVRLDIRKVEAIKTGQDEVGNHVRVKVIKNKVAPPFRKAEFDIMFGSGISKEGDLIDVGVQMGLVRKSGAFFYLNDQRLGQGRENAKDFLRENPDYAEEIEGLIRQQNNADKGLPVGDGVAVSIIEPEPDLDDELADDF